MTFFPVPNTGETLDGTREQIRTNIGLLKSSLAVNHGDLGNVDTGKHKFLQMPVQGSSPVTAINDLGFFASVIGGRNVLTFREANSGAVYALTGITPSVAATGYTPLIGSSILQWGTVTPVANQTLTAVAFPTPFPNNCFVVVVTEKRTGSPTGVDQVYVNLKVAAGFSYFATTSGAGFASFDWIAIGN